MDEKSEKFIDILNCLRGSCAEDASNDCTVSRICPVEGLLFPDFEALYRRLRADQEREGLRCTPLLDHVRWIRSSADHLPRTESCIQAATEVVAASSNCIRFSFHTDSERWMRQMISIGLGSERYRRSSWEWLSLSGYGLTVFSIESLRAAASVEAIKIQTTQCSQELLKVLGKLRGLTSLNLSDCGGITDAGVREIAKLTGLRSLNLSRCKGITPADVSEISKLTGLTSLDLSHVKNLTDAGVLEIAKLTELRSLNLRWCSGITDAGVREIPKLAELTSLNFV